MIKSTYDRLAGQSTERLAALSDGIFGVGMTLLVLDLREPAETLIHSEHQLLWALWALFPQAVTYGMSFLTLGIFWVGQQTQLNQLERTDRHLTWIQLGFLFAVTLMPFSTKLLGSFPTYRTALLGYWLNILILGIGLYASWGYATRHRLLKPDFTYATAAAICRRIQIAQVLYAVGAALCWIHPYVSIGFIVLVQLYFVLSPHYRVPTAPIRPESPGKQSE